MFSPISLVDICLLIAQSNARATKKKKIENREQVCRSNFN
jgi:hypothetical protein